MPHSPPWEDRSRGSQETFEGTANSQQLWTPDGKWVTFRSDRAGPFNLFWKPADGSGAAERLATSEYSQLATSWSPEGQALAFMQDPPTAAVPDIWVLPLEGERQPEEETGAQQSAVPRAPISGKGEVAECRIARSV